MEAVQLCQTERNIGEAGEGTPHLAAAFWDRVEKGEGGDRHYTPKNYRKSP